MPTYQVSARVRCAAPPPAVWSLLVDVDRWSSAREVQLRTEVVSAEPPRLLRYRVVAGLPVRDHEASVELLDVDGGTDICWTHRFRARIPGSGGFLRGRLEAHAQDSARRLADASTSIT